MKSIAETFGRKYGDKVDVISSSFFRESGDLHLKKYEQMISRQVRIYNRFPAIGYLATFICELSGSILASFGSMRLIAPVAYRRGVKRMEEIAPDAVFSTHWVTNYYAQHLKRKPLTVMYCPDAQQNALFSYPSDLAMISMPDGYRKALKRKRFNADNLKFVPFLIRNEAFSVSPDKRAARAALGLPEENFTVLLVEGGYGIGKMEAICKLLAKEHLPLTVIPVCGKNKALYRRFLALKTAQEITFRPYGFTEDMFRLEAAADLFCGKSGNILAEATFFGNPSIVTNCTSLIERHIAGHYIRTVGCAMKEFSPRKTVGMIKAFAKDPALLAPYREAANAYRGHFGSERAADELWEKIVSTFPGLCRDGAATTTEREDSGSPELQYAP
ncbi:MAG: hypothetical protein IJR89_01690 [Clostridia bacterium]|nr:hypothetical protein [Clostridia bacterium]